MPVGTPPCLGQNSSRVRDFLVILLLLVEVVGLQLWSGAYSGAFGGQPDEPAHYVTSLMIRDYVAGWFPEAPVPFAEEYYIHYPRVAFGLWPPLFHLVAGFWMLAFGVGRIGVLSLLAVTAAGWGYVLYRTARRVFGHPLALVSALLLVSLPAIQSSAQSMMLDLALGFWAFAAAVQFGKYLDTQDWRHSFMFGVLASAAILTKYNGLTLALLPPVCVLLTGRWSLLKRRSFWLPAGIVALLAGAWYAASFRSVMYAADPGEEWPEIWHTAVANLAYLTQMAGPVFWGLALLGGAGIVWRTRKRIGGQQPGGVPSGVMLSVTALVLCAWLFHTFLYPIQEARYLLPAAPCLILLSWAGIQDLLRLSLPWTGRSRAFEAAAAAAILLYGFFSFHIPLKTTQPYVAAAGKVLDQKLPENSVVLVCSDVNGEGMLIAEIAMREARPHHIVARSAKLLAEQRLMREDYRLLYRTPDELMAALDSIPVRMVVVDDCDVARCGAHSAVLAKAIESMPERWELVDDLRFASAGPIRIYRLLGNEEKEFNRIQLSMRYSLGKTLVKGGAVASGKQAHPAR